jgi:hypothetical protein
VQIAGGAGRIGLRRQGARHYKYARKYKGACKRKTGGGPEGSAARSVCLSNAVVYLSADSEVAKLSVATKVPLQMLRTEPEVGIEAHCGSVNARSVS